MASERTISDVVYSLPSQVRVGLELVVGQAMVDPDFSTTVQFLLRELDRERMLK